jgi:hypothetical protein
MSNAVSFLESLGSNANLRDATKNEIESALAGTQIAANVQAAILAGDQRQLESLLNVRAQMYCALEPGKEDDDEDAPSRDDDEISAQSGTRRLASAA